MTVAQMPITREESITRSFITRVYIWMFLALLMTAYVSMMVAGSREIMDFLMGSKVLFTGILIAELTLVIGLSAFINKLSPTAATVMFFVYSALTGVTFSSIYLVYSGESIAFTFFITAGTFGLMSIYGYTTKKDLTSWGSLLLMALFGVIIASFANIFFNNSQLTMLLTYASILIFVGLTAYDTQKIKHLGFSVESEEGQKAAIIGALALYLDFINLFLALLRITGRRK